MGAARRLERYRRSPCGERGLKYVGGEYYITYGRSLPVRGAWIEITDIYTAEKDYLRRSPCGERGLKFFRLQRDYHGALVAPRAGSVD